MVVNNSFICVLLGFLKKGKGVLEVLIKKEVIEMINDKWWIKKIIKKGWKIKELILNPYGVDDDVFDFGDFDKV